MPAKGWGDIGGEVMGKALGLAMEAARIGHPPYCAVGVGSLNFPFVIVNVSTWCVLPFVPTTWPEKVPAYQPEVHWLTVTVKGIL